MNARYIFIKTVGLTGLIAVLMLGSGAARADVGICKMAIDTAASNTAGAEFTGRNATKDEASLLGKLERAYLKLKQYKFADVIQKLEDYRLAVVSMADAAKPKINIVDAYGADGIADGLGGLEGDAEIAKNACNL